MKYILILILTISVVSCSFFNQRSAISYNDKIIHLQTKIQLKLDALGASFITRDSVLMFNRIAELQNTTDSSIAALEGLDGFDGSTELKDAALNVFRFYKRLASTEFQVEVNVLTKDSITEEDKKVLTEIDERTAADEKKLDDALLRAQNNLASKYHFKLKYSN